MVFWSTYFSTRQEGTNKTYFAMNAAEAGVAMWKPECEGRHSGENRQKEYDGGTLERFGTMFFSGVCTIGPLYSSWATGATRPARPWQSTIRRDTTSIPPCVHTFSGKLFSRRTCRLCRTVSGGFVSCVQEVGRLYHRTNMRTSAPGICLQPTADDQHECRRNSLHGGV